MNDTQRKRIEERLLEERKERLEALAEIDDRFKDGLATSDGDLTNYPLHMADEGTDTMEQEKESLLVHKEGEQLLEIHDSLRRLYREPDQFGACDQCGGEIAYERLEMVPWARLCIACQSEEEAGEDATEAGETATS